MFPDIASVLSTVSETEAKQQAKEQAQMQALADPANQAAVITEMFAPAVLATISNKHLGAIANPAGFSLTQAFNSAGQQLARRFLNRRGSVSLFCTLEGRISSEAHR
ncbi:MAG TPA: hypothetical protein VIK18_09465 [Pirellulales bacterium]